MKRKKNTPGRAGAGFAGVAGMDRPLWAGWYYALHRTYVGMLKEWRCKGGVAPPLSRHKEVVWVAEDGAVWRTVFMGMASTPLWRAGKLRDWCAFEPLVVGTGARLKSGGGGAR